MRASGVLVVLVLYLPLFSELHHLSGSHPYAGHVVLVPIAAAAVLWRERHRFRSLAGEGRTAGLGVTACAVVVGWTAHGVANLPLYVVSFVLAVGGLLLWLHGRHAVRAAVFPLALLLLMVPPPREAMSAVALASQHFVATSVAIMLSGIAVPVVQEGIFVRLPGVTLIVAEACSGLRFLLILSVFSAALAGTVLRGRRRRQVALVTLSILIAVLANVIRVAVTGAGAYAIGPDVATGPLHYYIGKGCWAAALVATMGLALSLRRRAVVAVPRLRSRAEVCVPTAS